MNTPDSETRPPGELNFFFRLAVASSAVFIITIFALVAALFGNPQAPPAQFLNAYGGVLIAGEVGVILFVAFVAMAVDRIRTVRNAPPVVETADSEADLSANVPSHEDPLS